MNRKMNLKYKMNDPVPGEWHRTCRKRNLVSAALILMLMVTLPGCSAFQTFEGQKDDKPNEYANVYELSSGRAYVWQDSTEPDIRKDISQNRVGEAVFFTCPTGDINFKGDELADMDQHPRSIWISSDKD